ncbi:MAG: prepilin peptidase [Clostridia bacterium]|nr:prepilin peptidase [Clostridia bacterium]
MYLNDVHIAYYIGAIILGLFVGQFIDWCNKRLPEHKKVISLDMFREWKIEFKPNYLLMFIMAIIYATLLYFFGIQKNIIENVDLIKFGFLAPLLISVFIIDYKNQIIPNRLNLIIFEVGIIFTFIYSLSNVAIAINMVLGMLVGGGIFLIITLIGGMFYGKETMGFGDVKLVAALGLFFGFSNTIIITLLSFLIGAILSIVLLLVKRKKTNEYIPFGPFITIAAFISMYVPFELLKFVLMKIFTLGLYGA